MAEVMVVGVQLLLLLLLLVEGVEDDGRGLLWPVVDCRRIGVVRVVVVGDGGGDGSGGRTGGVVLVERWRVVVGLTMRVVD